MKINIPGMKILAGFGLIIGILATAIMTNRASVDFKYLFVRPPINYFDQFYFQPLVWALCTFGVIFASGAIISKPRYFWPLYIAVGAVYSYSSCIVMLAERPFAGAFRITLMTLWIASPGILFIIEGLIIRHLKKKMLRKEKSNNEN